MYGSNSVRDIFKIDPHIMMKSLMGFVYNIQAVYYKLFIIYNVFILKLPQLVPIGASIQHLLG